MQLSEQIQKAGVVGAGGAGFPTHIKAQSNVEFVIVNGAECEPLIHKDYEIMKAHSREIVRGVELMIEATGAKKAYFGIKAKNEGAIEKISGHLAGKPIDMTLLGDFYPAGDEYELVYLATKRLIPAAGIPLDVGCVVNNVESFYNVALAAEGKPVTRKFVCITGAVKKPCTFWAPLGTPFRDLIAMAGGTTVQDFGIFVGGTMMGALTFDLDEVVTKTTAGLIVLPKDHYLIKRKAQPEQNWHRIGKSACDQCSYCTEFCPRYLLGYDVQPHKVMRSLGFTKSGAEMWNQYAELCCSCGLCTLYACPEDLYPKEACDKSKKEMRTQGVKFKQSKPVTVHPMKDGRRVPIKMLVKRLQLSQYDVHTPFTEQMPQPQNVKILLKQHIGAPATVKVSIGSRVSVGDLLAEPEGKALGSAIHASINGTVTHIGTDHIRITAG